MNTNEPLPHAFDPDAPLAELVGRLAKGKGLAELVRSARWKRKRPANEAAQEQQEQQP